MSRKKTYQDFQSSSETYQTIYNRFIKKYYGLFVSSIQWEGITPEQSDYIMQQFWDVGKVSAFQIKGIDDEVAFAPFVANSWDMYDAPIAVQLVNHRNSPYVPSAIQNVGKDVVLGYFLDNHMPVRDMVEYYCEKLTELEMTTRTNLVQQKMPSIINVNPNDNDKKRDIIKQVLNNEPIIFTDLSDDEMTSFKVNLTPTEYIVDKLTAESKIVEGELMTLLGVDNLNIEKRERLITSEADANNQEINMNANSHERRLTMFTDKIQDAFGITVSAVSSKMDTEDAETPQEGDTGSLSDKNEKEVN